MKIYVDIVLSGEKFNPFLLSEQYNIVFRKAYKKGDYNKRLKCCEKSGYAILSSKELNSDEKVIESILSEYETIFRIGEKELGIEYKEFNLYIECLQNSFTLNTLYLVRINKFFPEMNVTYIQEE